MKNQVLSDKAPESQFWAFKIGEGTGETQPDADDSVSEIILK